MTGKWLTFFTFSWRPKSLRSCLVRFGTAITCLTMLVVSWVFQCDDRPITFPKRLASLLSCSAAAVTFFSIVLHEIGVGVDGDTVLSCVNCHFSADALDLNVLKTEHENPNRKNQHTREEVSTLGSYTRELINTIPSLLCWFFLFGFHAERGNTSTATKTWVVYGNSAHVACV